MIKKIYLIRHAEPYFDFGEYTCLGRRTDPLLSMEGKQAAKKFAAEYEEIIRKSGVVYTSPLRRAKLTAFELSAFSGVPIKPISGLIEMDAGDWDGKTVSMIEEEYADLLAKDPGEDGITPPHGESFPHAAGRAVAAVSTIASVTPSDTVFIVAHASLNRALLCKLTGTPYRENRTIPQDYLAVNILEYDTETNTLTVITQPV